MEKKPSQTGCPNLPTEDASQDDMVHRFHGLVANNASIALLETMAMSPMRRPTAAMHEPEEEYNTWISMEPYAVFYESWVACHDIVV
jgi:hypothetical protein